MIRFQGSSISRFVRWTLASFCAGALSWPLAAPVTRDPAIPGNLAAPALKLLPQESPAFAQFRKGVQHLARGDLTAAEAAFKLASAKDARLAAPLIGLAHVALQRGQSKEAERLLSRALDLEPGSDETWVAWGRFKRAQGQFADAETSFRKAVSLGNPVTAKLELGDLYLTDMHKVGAAPGQFREAASADPSSAAAHYRLGVALAVNKQAQDAVQSFERAASLAPRDPEPVRAIGRLQAEQRDFKRAAATFDRALVIRPDHAPLLVDRGDVAAATGDWTLAASCFRKALNAAPGAAAVWLKLGLAEMQLKNLDSADKSFRKAIELAPKQPEAYNSLAWLLAERKIKLDEALRLAEVAVRLSPRDASVIDTLATVHRARGDHAKALEVLLGASQLLPDNAALQLRLGSFALEAGDKERARRAWERVLALDPKGEQGREARRRIEAL